MPLLSSAEQPLISEQPPEQITALKQAYADAKDDSARQAANSQAELSARSANKLADSKARRYQADRVAYMDGLLNSCGRDGRVTDEYGNQFIGKLLGEDPTLANFYAQIYPNALELLGSGRDADLTKIGATHNEGIAARADERRFNYGQAADLDYIRKSEKVEA